MLGLKYIRTAFGYSMQNLADKIGVTRQTIYKWENGIKKIPQKRVEEMSKSIFCNIPYEYYEKELSDVEKLKTEKIRLENVKSKNFEIKTKSQKRESKTVIKKGEKPFQENTKTIEAKPMIKENAPKEDSMPYMDTTREINQYKEHVYRKMIMLLNLAKEIDEVGRIDKTIDSMLQEIKNKKP